MHLRCCMNAFMLLLAVLLIPMPAFAQHRCTDNGRVIITDRPCTTQQGEIPASSNTKVIGDAGNIGYSTSNGVWRGQVQFMAKSGTTVINEAHAVVPFVIEIDPQGKVSGTGNGCTLKGIAAPSAPMETITSIDVTLKNCSHPAYNRQMTGRLALYKAQKYVDFSLQSYDMQRRPSGYYEIKGTLRR